jgi:hypothetical protein
VIIGRGPEIRFQHRCFDVATALICRFLSRGNCLQPNGDKDNRRRVAEGAGIDFGQAKSLTPLPGNDIRRKAPASTYMGGQSERGHSRLTFTARSAAK